MDNPIVAQKRRLRPPADYHALAERKGLKWLGPFTGKVVAPTTWECERGHRFESPYYVVSRDGYGCPQCNRRQPEDYRARAALRGFVWLGPDVDTTAVPTRWRCSCGHEWETSFQSLRGCPQCWYERNGAIARRPPSDYYLLAQQRNCEWLGPEVHSTRAPTNWRCPNGHEWQATYSSVHRGRGCVTCALAERSERVRIKPEQYRELAAACGFIWLGPEVATTREKTWWQCVQGHKYYAPYDMLRKGPSCPECQDLVNGRRVSRPQRALCDMVSGALNYKIGRCSVDVALFRDDAKIGIEYDSYYWHGKTQDNDYRRAQYMIRRGWRILSVKANGQLPTMEQVNTAIESLLGGDNYTEIMLDDWGNGKAR